jgi:chaperonin GroEL
MKIVAIKPPRYGLERRNILEDLCINTGSTFISRESGIRIKDIKLQHFGSAKKVEVQKNYTAIVGGNGELEKVKTRIDDLKELIKNSDDMEECKKSQERITRLSSGIAIIYVGGNTEMEVVEKRHRIEDAVEACRSAIEQGILTGGGVALMKISSSMENLLLGIEKEDVRFGILTVQKAIQEPFKKLIQNAKKNVELIESKCDFSNDLGYNAATDKIENIFDAGIIDPTKVVCCAVRHAISAATTILFCEAAILSI